MAGALWNCVLQASHPRWCASTPDPTNTWLTLSLPQVYGVWNIYLHPHKGGNSQVLIILIYIYLHSSFSLSLTHRMHSTCGHKKDYEDEFWFIRKISQKEKKSRGATVMNLTKGSRLHTPLPFAQQKKRPSCIFVLYAPDFNIQINKFQ